MTDEERQQMERLCDLVANEKDPGKFDEYVRQLNELLELKHARFILSTSHDQIEWATQLGQRAAWLAGSTFIRSVIEKFPFSLKLLHD